MRYSFSKIYVHLVWATKSRQRLFTERIRPAIYKHLEEYAGKNGIRIECHNVQAEHVHVLLDVATNQNVEDIAKLLKGESSHWLNDQKLIAGKFSWQRGYGAFSISTGHLRAVREYIRTQDEHHRRYSYMEEYRRLLRKNGFGAQEITDAENVD